MTDDRTPEDMKQVNPRIAGVLVAFLYAITHAKVL